MNLIFTMSLTLSCIRILGVLTGGQQHPQKAISHIQVYCGYKNYKRTSSIKFLILANWYVHFAIFEVISLIWYDQGKSLSTIIPKSLLWLTRTVVCLFIVIDTLNSGILWCFCHVVMIMYFVFEGGWSWVTSSPIEHLVSWKLEYRKNIRITCIRHYEYKSHLQTYHKFHAAHLRGDRRDRLNIEVLNYQKQTNKQKKNPTDLHKQIR